MHFSQNCDNFLILFPHPSSLLSSHIGRCSMKLKEGVVGSYAFAPSISFRKFSVWAGVYLVANQISQGSAKWLCFIVLCSRTTGSQLQDRMDARAVNSGKGPINEMTARSKLFFIFPQRWGSLGIISQEWHSRHSWGNNTSLCRTALCIMFLTFSPQIPVSSPKTPNTPTWFQMFPGWGEYQTG